MSSVKSVLLIDGSTHDRRHYSRILKAVSLLIFQAGNGADGLKLYRSQPIDCVILEFNLPDVSGAALLKQLALLSRIPLFVLTRLSYPTIGEYAKQNGATATFVKRMTPDRVLQDAVLEALASGSVRSHAVFRGPRRV